MQFLYNSTGKCIAIETKAQLHALSGQNIGHYLRDEGIFIDMNGRYIGEIVHGNRLMFRLGSPHENVSYGDYGDHGNIGGFENPGTAEKIMMIDGFRDIDPH